MVLTREQTITEHRKMWKWISRMAYKIAMLEERQ